MKNKIVISLIMSLFIIDDVASQKLWRVDDCMRYAVENSNKLKKQDIKEDDARNTLAESKFAFLPSISASSSMNNSFGRSIDPETNSYVSTSTLGNSYSAYASLDLFNGLQNINNLKIAQVSKLRAELEGEQIKAQVATKTMNAYYTAIFAHGALHIAYEELNGHRKNYDQAKAEYEVGLSNLSDLLQLESLLSQSEYNITNLKGEYLKKVVALKDQMYFPLDIELAIDTLANPTGELLPNKENVEDVFAIAQNKLPEFDIWDADVRVAKLELSMAKASLYPSLRASGGISSGYSKFLGSEMATTSIPFSKQLEDRLGQNVGVTLSIPIFGGLSRRKAVTRKRYAYETAQIVRVEQSREIESLIYQAVIDLDSYHEQCDKSLINVKSNQMSYKTTEAKFKEGLSTVVELQTVQTNLSRAKIDRLKAYLNYQMQDRVVGYYKGESLIR